MALIGNYGIHNRTPGRSLGGTSIAGNKGTTASRGNFNNASSSRAAFYGDAGLGFAKYNSVPNGTSPPYSWVIPQKSGGMAASVGRVSGSGSVAGSLAQGVGISSDLSGVGTISNADLNLIIALVATLSGTGTISSADLAAIQNLAATLAGTGAISSADAALIVGITAALSGSGTASASTDFTGIAHMTADISPFTSLSPEGLAASLLDNNDIETGYSLRESLRLILASLAGKLSGAPGTTITIRDVNDTIDRIVATVDASGNRTDVTKDVSDV